jgi:hypothetical protein
MGGSIFGTSEAFAACPNNDCVKPSSTNYKTCADCQCKVLNVLPDCRVSATTAQNVYKCWKQPSWCGYPGTPAQWKKYDLDGNGVVDSVDYTIANKCVGCCSTPSPFK